MRESSVVKKVFGAVIYARVSSKEQEQEGFSIPAQLKLLHNYALEKGYAVDQEFTDVETAKGAGRVGFNQMLKFIKSKASIKFEGSRQVLIVEKTDRLYRNLKDWISLDDYDIEIHFVKENCIISRDSKSSEKLMHGIKVLMAKNYIDNLSEETKKGMTEKAAQGIWPSNAPLGYLNVAGPNGKKIIIPDKDLKPRIREVFEWYATGQYSLSNIAKMAKTEGLSSPRTRIILSKSAIHKMLTNSLYYGDFTWDGKFYRGTHEPIITKELFDSVREVLTGHGHHRPRSIRHQWAFQGLISCGHCGCAMVAEKKKGKYTYYHCTGNKGKCSVEYVREEEIDRQFLESIKAIKMDEDVLKWVMKALKESHEDERRYHEEKVRSLQNQYNVLQKRIDAMYIDKLDGKVLQDFFNQKSEEWRMEQGDILHKIEKHQKANQSYLCEGVQLIELAQKAAALYERQDLLERRRLLNVVHSNCTWKDGKLFPNYRKPFDLLVVTNTAQEQKRAAFSEKCDPRHIWLPEQDSNLRQGD